MSQKVGANQVTAKGAEFLDNKSGFAYVKYHVTTHARRRLSQKVAPPDRQDFGFKGQTKIGVRIVVTAGR